MTKERVLRIRKDGYVSRPKPPPRPPARERANVRSPDFHGVNDMPPVTHEEAAWSDTPVSYHPDRMHPPGRGPDSDRVTYDYRFYLDLDISMREEIYSANVQVGFQARQDVYQHYVRIPDFRIQIRGHGLDTYVEVGVMLTRGLMPVIFVPLFVDRYCDFIVSLNRGNPGPVESIRQEIMRTVSMPNAQ